jgi:hypothetical protein
MSLRKRLLATAAAVTMAATMQAGTAFAQNSGLGGDGFTRLMWRGTDYHISLWKLDKNLNGSGSHEYGPYANWIPVALTSDTYGYSYVLWRNTDGSISLWLVDPNLNMVSYHQYGPYPGWIAKGLSADTSGSSANFRVIWRYYDGSVSVWNVDGGLNYVTSQAYGPYFGFDPGYTTE